MEIVFSASAARQWKRLPVQVRKRIQQKLWWYVKQPNLLHFAKPLHNVSHGQYRLRFGDYRLIFDAEKSRIVVLAVGHRRDIYQ